MNPLREADDLLRALGTASVDHPGGTLLAHLRRTCALLAGWGAPLDLRLAGLCHALYGTDGFDRRFLDIDRPEVLAAVVGSRAERHVRVYARCDRQAVYPVLHMPAVIFRDRVRGLPYGVDDGERRAFAELTAANELDVVRHSPRIAAEHGPALAELFGRVRPLLSPGAAACWAQWP